jgi:hypothetical protein
VLAALTYAEGLAMLRRHVDGDWLDRVMSDPDGAATVRMLVDGLVRLDGEDARRAASLRIRPDPDAVAPPASRAEYATATLAIRRRRLSPVAHVMPAGTLVQTLPDRIVFRTDAPLIFPAGEADVWHEVGATATFPGPAGFIPPDEITSFVGIANGANGIGQQIAIVDDGTGDLALQFLTTLQPDLFRSSWAGLYIEITATGSGPQEQNLGLMAQLLRAGALTFPDEIESQYATSVIFDPVVDQTVPAMWFAGTFEYSWAVRDWDDLGFDVRNTTEVVGGAYPLLDEIATARGLLPLVDEGTEALRARVLARPQKPTPLGVLRKALLALQPFGFGRQNLRIYELGATSPDVEVDPYAENFPAAGGFIGDLHVTDMPSPETPDGLAALDPEYFVVPVLHNPGPVVPMLGSETRSDVVRHDVPPLPDEMAAAIRRDLYAAATRGDAPGSTLELWEPDQWLYP